ncbi:ribonuclease D [Cellulomonas sp. Y8]|uniref:ribonuclease D n=1 Tax=Cellulomonas sp. Y8 TaxID=2591145 RepID=UPI003D74C40F
MATIVVRGDLPEDVADQLLRARRVAVDTETTGLDWRWERLALCQVHAPETGTILVQLDGSRTPERLSALVSDPDVTKVFHHAPFDLRFMLRTWGGTAQNIACTKVASKVLHPGRPNDEHSLRALVRRRLGIPLDKGAVRTSDWSARTLTVEQLSYAAADVEHLLPLLDGLLGDLEEVGRAAQYISCCEYLPTQVDLSLRGLEDAFAY